MRRFRTQWLAVFGALVVLSLSLSTAFGARPTPDTDEATNFGQQVSTFVHLLLSGTSDEDESGEEGTGDETGDDCQPASDEDGSTDEDGTADDGSGDAAGDTCDESDETSGDEDSGDEDSGEQVSADPTAQNHGQCVAEVANSDAVGDNGTHGWAVMLAAQVTCWLEEQSDESGSGDESTGGDEDGTTDQTSDASSADHPHGKSDAAHQRKLDRGKGQPSWVSLASHGGHGKGHGRF